MSKNNSDKVSKERLNEIKQLSKSSSIVGVDELIDLLNSPKRLGWLRFYGGFMAGVGGVIGAALVIVLLGFAVKHLGGVPWIGDLLNQISNATHSAQNAAP